MSDARPMSGSSADAIEKLAKLLRVCDAELELLHLMCRRGSPPDPVEFAGLADKQCRVWMNTTLPLARSLLKSACPKEPRLAHLVAAIQRRFEDVAGVLAAPSPGPDVLALAAIEQLLLAHAELHPEILWAIDELRILGIERSERASPGPAPLQEATEEEVWLRPRFAWRMLPAPNSNTERELMRLFGKLRDRAPDLRTKTIGERIKCVRSSDWQAIVRAIEAEYLERGGDLRPAVDRFLDRCGIPAKTD